MNQNDPWKNVVKSIHNMGKTHHYELDTKWSLCYTDGVRNIAMEHTHANLEDVLNAFEDFCKGAGFIFDGFAIVDDDGIPVNGLNRMARLESDEDDSQN